MRELVRRAQGEYECVPCEGGCTALAKVLNKGRAKGKILVLVGEESALVPAVGRDGWEELVDAAGRFGIVLRLSAPSPLSYCAASISASRAARRFSRR